MSFRFFKADPEKKKPEDVSNRQTIDLGNGSEVIYIPRFKPMEESWDLFHYLDKNIPWTRPTNRVFGKTFSQPRDTCYVASDGLPDLSYNGYQPHAYSWDDYPPLKDLLNAVHEVLPGSVFNSLLLNRYKEERSSDEEPQSKRSKRSNNIEQHSFTLKHGSLLVMRGYTQRNWVHSVPKRAKAETTRINLTFQRVL